MVNEKMELRIINPTEEGFLKRINWNKEELETAIRYMTSEYSNIVYTEENMKQAKDDRAELNKLLKAIDERRKMVKKIINEPYDIFEKELNEIKQLIQEPASIIDTQIKNYENQQKEEKKLKLMEVWQSAVSACDITDMLTFEMVFKPEYLNASVSLKKATTEIKETVEKFKTDMETIDGLDDKYKVYAKDVYIKTMDLSKALSEERRLKALDEKLEAERKAKEEAEARRLAEEEAKRIEEEKRVKELEESKKHEEPEEVVESEEPVETHPTSDIGKAIQSIEQQAFNNAVTGQDPIEQETESTRPVNVFEPKQEAPKVQEKRYKATFWCTGTLEQIKALGDYMRANNIEFGKVEK